MTAVPSPASTFYTNANEDENGLPDKAQPRGQGGHCGLDSQATSTRRWEGQEIQVPKGKVLVRWLRKLEVPQLFLVWDVRKLSPEEPGTEILGAG